MRKTNSIQYQTSPFVILQFLEVTKMIELTTKNRFSFVKFDVLAVLWFFLNPHTINQAKSEGLSTQAIKLCVTEKFILKFEGIDLINAFPWEKNNWTRSAYITFSQLDLTYADVRGSTTPQEVLVQRRRKLMEQSVVDSQYPKRYRPRKIISTLHLDASPNGSSLDFDSIKDRKTIRKYSDEQVGFSEFRSILTEATENVRIAKSSQDSGDPFFILNSFYSWLVVYVYIQNVEGVSKGLYYYDVEFSDLCLIRTDIEDKAVIPCIQGQSWIGGGGFCVFLGAHWSRYAWIYRHSRAYINLLIQLGEISEEFILSSYKHKLGSWMTPAVSEDKINLLCGIDAPEVDILFFMKHGKPQR